MEGGCCCSGRKVEGRAGGAHGAVQRRRPGEEVIRALQGGDSDASAGPILRISRCKNINKTLTS